MCYPADSTLHRQVESRAPSSGSVGKVRQATIWPFSSNPSRLRIGECGRSSPPGRGASTCGTRSPSAAKPRRRRHSAAATTPRSFARLSPDASSSRAWAPRSTRRRQLTRSGASVPTDEELKCLLALAWSTRCAEQRALRVRYLEIIVRLDAAKAIAATLLCTILPCEEPPHVEDENAQ